MKKIAIINQKGGVGKTTTTVNLGVALARKGARVLLVDFDPQANLTTHLGFSDQEEHYNISGALEDLMNSNNYTDTIRKAIQHHEEGVDVISGSIDLAALEFKMQASVASEYKLKKLLRVLEDDYDYCLIDCQPSLNILPINAMTAADSLLIPVATQGLAVKGLTDLIATASGIQSETNGTLSIIGILFTFAETNTVQTREVMDMVSQAYSNDSDMPIFTTVIPKAVIGGMTAMTGHSIFFKNSSTPLAQRYMELAGEIIQKQ